MGSENPTRMHASFTRLMECAARATARDSPDRRVQRARDLVRWLGVSPQVVTNWKRRGVAREGALRAETAAGRPCASWILSDGPPPEWVAAQRSVEGLSTRPRGAETLLKSVVRLAHDAPRVPWEDIVQAKLPYLFEVVMPDDSMAPWLFALDAVRFQRGGAPKAGEIVLVRDAAQRAYVRIFRPRSATTWTARPINDAYAPLESDRDGLEVLGRFCGMDRPLRLNYTRC